MITSSQEDYLKTIYHENIKGNKVTNKLIASKLNISAPSVSAMLNKLIEDGLIKKDKQYGFMLTEEGTNQTQVLLSKHRLWEVFLIDYLGYTWDEVHTDADLLEHVTSPKLFTKLNSFLGRPTTCPHGEVIYQNQTNQEIIVGKRLSEVDVGFTGTIHTIEDNSELLQYLTTKGIDLNNEFTIKSIDSFDNSYTLLLSQAEVTISIKAAEQIYVI